MTVKKDSFMKPAFAEIWTYQKMELWNKTPIEAVWNFVESYSTETLG
jgi:hypothetical protein